MSQSNHHQDETSPETDRETQSHEEVSGIPSECWKRRLDTKLAFKQKPFSVGVKEGVRLFPLGVRLFSYVYRERKHGRDPVLDPLNEIKPNDNQGVAIGGIGSGAITRGWRGEFCRWSLVPGRPRYRTVEADQFSVFIQRQNQPSVAKVLTPHHKPKNLKSWDWSMKGDKSYYNALFPRAWTVYQEPDPKLRLTCQQFSPVIANNYQESSYPVGIFVWDIENLHHTPVDVSLMFTFQSGTGGFGDANGGYLNVPIDTSTDKGKTVVGVEMKNASYKRLAVPGKKQHTKDMLTFVIASEVEDGATVTRSTAWNPHGDGSEIWRKFSTSGTIEEVQTVSNPTFKGQTTASAIAVKQSLGPYQKKKVVFVLSWDTPIARFGSGRGHYRRYTRFYGRDGTAAPKIALDALNKWEEWLSSVESWQNQFLKQREKYPDLPSWYHTALINELYYLVDGGTIWTDGDAGGGPQFNGQNYHNEENPEFNSSEEVLTSNSEYGHFAYLESHEYIMYNTYDVHFYAGFALIQLWPQIELSLQRDIARVTLTGLREEVIFCGDGRRSPRKMMGMAPHDIGSPGGDPWFSPNSYTVQDVNRWKDLNSKLILQIYRDYVATQDKSFLQEMLPVVLSAYKNLKRFDKDNDGVIENEGYPDQTYDAWSVRGISAYCGGLWLACVAATRAMLIATDAPAEDITPLTETLTKGKLAYKNALWNGSYFNYDNSNSKNSITIMSDQLAGQWYAKACGLEDIVDEDLAKDALLTVFNNNVMKLHGGQAGAVNGMRPDGKVDYASMQSSEIWTGTTYGLAASLIQQGLIDQGFRTAYGIYKGTYETYGYWFQTPESWDTRGRFRAPAYMRPLAVWSLQWAIDRVVPSSALETSRTS